MKPALRPWPLPALLIAFAGVVGGGSLSGCSTEPVNPDGCEAIETARCRAAPACPSFGEDFDVEACERFYRDQCLRGLQTDDDPGEPEINVCVDAIEKAGACARDSVTPCDVGGVLVDDPCDLIAVPEDYDPCGFLDDYFEEDAGMSPFPEGGADGGVDAPPDGPVDEAG